MTKSVLILAGLFLPLFPLSMLFNILFTRLRNPVLRSVLLLAWPQIGIAIVLGNSHAIPHWLVVWAVLSSLLYALRALALRDVGLWIGFISTSAWSLLWILADTGAGSEQLKLYALGISIPLVLMSILAAGLERRFGAAYLGLYGGLAKSLPRFSGVLVVVVLAVIATPLFPSFFSMLSMIMKSIPTMPTVAVAVAIVWLLWSWAGAKLLQGLIVGPGEQAATDISRAGVWFFVIILVALVIAGIYWLGAVV